jgi:soluble lytic murein transglycosylase-like protein
MLSFGTPRPAEEPAASVRPAVVAAPSAPRADEAAIQAVAAYFHAHRSRLSDREIRRVSEQIVASAAEHGLDPQLVMAVIHIESRGNAYALSHVGAIGLMQIMPPTGEELAGELGLGWSGTQVLFDPLVNVRIGIAYLKQLERRYNSVEKALAAYNWGPGRIDGFLRRGDALPAVYYESVLAARRDVI